MALRFRKLSERSSAVTNVTNSRSESVKPAIHHAAGLGEPAKLLSRDRVMRGSNVGGSISLAIDQPAFRAELLAGFFDSSLAAAFGALAAPVPAIGNSISR